MLFVTSSLSYLLGGDRHAARMADDCAIVATELDISILGEGDARGMTYRE